MKKSIKNSIIINNLTIVLFSLFVLLLMIFTFSIKTFYTNSLVKITQVNIKWLEIEDKLYLSMTRWLDGKLYEEVLENKKDITIQLNNIIDSNLFFLYPENLQNVITKMKELWILTEKETLEPLQQYIEEFVLSHDILQLEDEQKQLYARINTKNYFKSLNIRELVYTKKVEEWNKYTIQGIRLLERVDLFYNSTDGYNTNSKKAVKYSEDITNMVNLISTIILIILILLEIGLGIIYSIKNGNRISRPIVRASNNLISFVGESLDSNDNQNDDEILQLNNCVDTLILHYNKLSDVAKKLSIGDTSEVITPKSENDVMGNAFLNIVKYLERLTTGANEIIKGNYEYKVEESSEKDILAKTYNQLSDAIVNLLEKTKEITRLESEMEAASKIQAAVLPKRDEKLEGYEIAHITMAATEVGGDSYDFRSTINGNWISIGDVSGHGLESGIIALISQSAFNYGAYLFEKEKYDNPHVLMYNYVNRTMVLLNKIRGGSDAFMTQNYFFEKDGTFFCAGAHEIALVYRKKDHKVDELKELTGNVPYMGIISDIDSETSNFTFTMETGDILLLYTDGLIEARNKDGEQFDVPRVKNILLQNCKKGVDEIKKELIDRLYDFAKDGDIERYNGSFADDVTILIFRRE